MEAVEYQKMYNVESNHWWYMTLHDLVLRSLPRDRNDLRILDAGCGTGRLLQLMEDRGDVSGCDRSAAAVTLCRRRGVANVVLCDLNTVLLPDASYDVITSIDVLYHKAVRDERRVLAEFHHALKTGGTLILQLPAYDWLRSEHDLAVHTARRYTKNALVKMLEDCGFLVERATYRVTLLFVPIVLVKLLRKMVRHWGMGTVAASDVKKHSAFANTLLAAIMKTENCLLKHLSLPFGTSVFAVARKPQAPGA